MLSLLLTFALTLNAPPPKQCQLRGGDGQLVLYSYPHQEVLEVDYLKADGSFDEQALQQIDRLMRSPDDGVASINLHLVRLFDQIQDHFGADTVEIISGYRSLEYNAQLKAEGHAVARESFHLKGQATDLHLDEITETALRDYVQGLGCGGVGFYPRLHFVHLDFGPKRRWGEAKGTRQLVGEKPMVWETNKNYYRQGETVRWKSDAPLTLQHFKRGKWHNVRKISPNTNALTMTPKLRHGKYRLKGHKQTPRFSNEFYFKKI